MSVLEISIPFEFIASTINSNNKNIKNRSNLINHFSSNYLRYSNLILHNQYKINCNFDTVARLKKHSVKCIYWFVLLKFPNFIAVREFHKFLEYMLIFKIFSKNLNYTDIQHNVQIFFPINFFQVSLIVYTIYINI